MNVFVSDVEVCGTYRVKREGEGEGCVSYILYIRWRAPVWAFQSIILFLMPYTILVLEVSEAIVIYDGNQGDEASGTLLLCSR